MKKSPSYDHVYSQKMEQIRSTPLTVFGLNHFRLTTSAPRTIHCAYGMPLWANVAHSNTSLPMQNALSSDTTICEQGNGRYLTKGKLISIKCAVSCAWAAIISGIDERVKVHCVAVMECIPTEMIQFTHLSGQF